MSEQNAPKGPETDAETAEQAGGGVDQIARGRGAGKGALRLVGVASSAGGLEALRDLLPGLPSVDGLAYVIAQHVSPNQPNALVDLLVASTQLTVCTLEDGTPPRSRHIYVIPPNHDAILRDGLLHLVEPSNDVGPKPSANHLFQSMAQALGEESIGIVLSGSGSDATLGLRAIKKAGGVTLAQDPASAAHDGMPKSAIQDGSVDLVLAPAAMGMTLARLLNEPRAEAMSPEDIMGSDYARIAQIVYQRTAFHLDDYKAATVHRRIARRQGFAGISSLQDYIEYLRVNPDEAQLLMRDTFISVTAFFRDPDAFAAMSLQIEFLVKRSQTGTLRCWVAGCATGEEAYSIAMLFEDTISRLNRTDLQYLIFASDLDEGALRVARAATYSMAALDDIPPDMRERFIEPLGDRGRVIKDIRNHLVFARQNVIADPPFGRLDIISCRNLLIYLNPPAQGRVLEIFHHSLNPGGCLFLGRAETPEARPGLFATQSSQARVYLRLEADTKHPLPMLAKVTQEAAAAPVQAPATSSMPDSLARTALNALAQRFAPPSVLLNEADNVVYLHGDLRPFLSFPSGQMNANLIDLVNRSIRTELRVLLARARRGAESLTGAAFRATIEGVRYQVECEITPVDSGLTGGLSVSFLARPEPAAPNTGRQHDAATMSESERELVNTRAQLALVVDELESSHERFQLVSEELRTTNEELQVANEELQSANEELQSTNEELITVNDELQRKSAQLGASLNDLDNVKESLDFPLLVVDSNLRLTQINKAGRRVVLPGGSGEGQMIAELRWRMALSGLEQDLLKVLHSGERMSRLCSNRPDGENFHLHLMPYVDNKQVVRGVVLLFEDISERLRQETALRDSESRYRQVTECLPQLVWTATPDGDWDYLSPQWVAYTGVPAADQLGDAWLQQVHPEDREMLGSRWQAALASGGAYADEYRIRRHDGQYLWFQVLASPLRDEGKKIVRWFGCSTDIQDRREREAELEEYRHGLEDLVRTRTADLLVAKEEAEAANIAKGAFLANISHELRTPMNGLLGMIDLVAQGLNDPPRLLRLRKAHESGQRLLAILNDILDFSKIEADSLSLVPQPTTFEEIVAHLKELFEAPAAKKGLSLRFSIGAGLAHRRLLADPLRLGQVLINLLSNALKFSSEGSVLVSVQALGEADERLQVRAEVTDQGIGIPEEVQHRLFRRFEQGDNSSARLYGGTGLGLAISKRLIELMGGEIGVISQPGQGSTFWFTVDLPLTGEAGGDTVSAPLSVKPDEMPALTVAEQIRSRFAGTPVLIVEDDEISLEIEQCILEALELSVDMAGSGAAALALIREKTYGLVITDVHLPDGDGYELAREIHNVERNRATPIIAVTGSVFPEDIERCHQAGIHGHVAKPFELEVLQRAVLAALSGPVT